MSKHMKVTQTPITENVTSLLSASHSRNPWLYTLGYESVIDVNENETSNDWRNRVQQMVHWQKSSTLWSRASLIAALLLSAAIVFLGSDSPFLPVGNIILAIAITGSVVTTLRFRKSRKGLIIGEPGSPLHSETFKLGATLDALHKLKDTDLSELGVPEGYIEEKLDADALEDIARHLLTLKFPEVDAEYVKSVREDVENSFTTATGLRIQGK